MTWVSSSFCLRKCMKLPSQTNHVLVLHSRSMVPSSQKPSLCDIGENVCSRRAISLLFGAFTAWPVVDRYPHVGKIICQLPVNNVLPLQMALLYVLEPVVQLKLAKPTRWFVCITQVSLSFWMWGSLHDGREPQCLVSPCRWPIVLVNFNAEHIICHISLICHDLVNIKTFLKSTKCTYIQLYIYIYTNKLTTHVRRHQELRTLFGKSWTSFTFGRARVRAHILNLSFVVGTSCMRRFHMYTTYQPCSCEANTCTCTWIRID